MRLDLLLHLPPIWGVAAAAVVVCACVYWGVLSLTNLSSSPLFPLKV